MIRDAEYQAALRYVSTIDTIVRASDFPRDTLLGRDGLYVVLGIGSRETAWGTSRYLDRPGPHGRGDKGHGHGLMQIDDRWHPAFIASGHWAFARENIAYGVGVLRQAFLYFRRKDAAEPLLSRAAIAAYNAGPGRVWEQVIRGIDPDVATTGRDYSADVLRRAAAYRHRIETDFRGIEPQKIKPLPPERLSG